MSKKQSIIVVALMALSVVIGALLVTDFRKIPLGLAGPDVKLGADNPPVNPSQSVTTLNDAFVAVSKAVTPQVVSIVVTTKSPVPDQNDENGDQGDGGFDPFEMFRFQPKGPQRGSGSGVVITPDGYILTNNHVVESAATNGITVELNDGRRFDAKLIGRDPLTDLAVVKIEATDLPTAAFGNSDDAQVGQLVIAVGNPLGLNSTVTQGIISALGRGQLNLNRDAAGYGVEDFIQTDAAINPGNSGGGLFDLRGALIGINSAIATRTGYYQGYGFAIPVNLARSVAQDLIEDGKVNRGYIGVQIKPVDPTMAKALNLPQREGVLIGGVVPNGAAAAAGLKQSDVILEVDGQTVSTPNHLQSIVARKRAGEEVKLKVFRDGKTFETTVRLKPRDEKDDLAEERNPAEADEITKDTDRNVKLDQLGMAVRTLDPQTRKQSGVDHGVLVSKVDMYSEAQDQGLTEGDIILSVNRKAVNSPEDFRKIVESSRAGDAMLLQIKRKGGSTDLVALEVKK
jgi:serine protease Do